VSISEDDSKDISKGRSDDEGDEEGDVRSSRWVNGRVKDLIIFQRLSDGLALVPQFPARKISVPRDVRQTTSSNLTLSALFPWRWSFETMDSRYGSCLRTDGPVYNS
jgi:hypothetical protein